MKPNENNFDILEKFQFDTYCLGVFYHQLTNFLAINNPVSKEIDNLIWNFLQTDFYSLKDLRDVVSEHVQKVNYSNVSKEFNDYVLLYKDCMIYFANFHEDAQALESELDDNVQSIVWPYLDRTVVEHLDLVEDLETTHDLLRRDFQRFNSLVKNKDFSDFAYGFVKGFPSTSVTGSVIKFLANLNKETDAEFLEYYLKLVSYYAKKLYVCHNILTHDFADAWFLFEEHYAAYVQKIYKTFYRFMQNDLSILPLYNDWLEKRHPEKEPQIDEIIQIVLKQVQENGVSDSCLNHIKNLIT